MKYSVELEQQEWNMVLSALGSRPYIEVAKLIEEMAKQLTDQTKEAGGSS